MVVPIIKTMAAALIPKSLISKNDLATFIKAIETAAIEPGPPISQSVKPAIKPTTGWNASFK